MKLRYRPWAKQVFDDSIARFVNGSLPTLDLELSARCSHAACIYCDSRVGKAVPGELQLREIRKMLDEGGTGLRWVYICGLGEPLDDPKFMGLMKLLHERGIEVSVFTNGFGITEDIAEFLSDRHVCLILKLDSFDAETFDRLLGKKGSSRKVFRALDYLLSAGYPMTDPSGCSRLALSIVPTSWNLDEVPRVVEYCRDNAIFPSIGELEYSGKARQMYEDLHVEWSEIENLKSEVDRIMGTVYCRDLCPAAITGIHIDNLGNCSVDRETGLSCNWFLLREPALTTIGNARRDSLPKLRQRVIEYRLERLENTVKLQQEVPSYPFGGCGGSPTLLLESYLEAMERIRIGST